MASELTFKKEFEDVILKQNVEAALNSLAPKSKEYIYLQFCEEFKKCISSQKISKKLNSILEDCKSLPDLFLKVLKTRKNLLEYDLPSTTEKRKKAIIDELYNDYCNNLRNNIFIPTYTIS
mgnify:CR=1 FL=1